jgi:hypothetical protein
MKPLAARLTDLDRERIRVSVLNVSTFGLALLVEDRFTLDFPVLIECGGLLIVGNVRHCVEAAKGGYVLGLKVNRVVEAAGTAKQQNHERAVAA